MFLFTLTHHLNSFSKDQSSVAFLSMENFFFPQSPGMFLSSTCVKYLSVIWGNWVKPKDNFGHYLQVFLHNNTLFILWLSLFIITLRTLSEKVLKFRDFILCPFKWSKQLFFLPALSPYVMHPFFSVCNKV